MRLHDSTENKGSARISLRETVYAKFKEHSWKMWVYNWFVGTQIEMVMAFPACASCVLVYGVGTRAITVFDWRVSMFWDMA